MGGKLWFPITIAKEKHIEHPKLDWTSKKKFADSLDKIQQYLYLTSQRRIIQRVMMYGETCNKKKVVYCGTQKIYVRNEPYLK